MINLINERCQLSEELETYPTADLTLSILGTQGSGKSTLLNHVFQSNFPTLEASVQRTRCTSGVWLHHSPNFNIIDTQGFDSMERGDDQKIFEKQMSLFCVVISDIILINLYMDEIGRYTGGHMDILDAVFKVGERLVAPHKKKIIYIIRDCVEDADQHILSNQLNEEIKTLQKQYNINQLKYSIQFHFMSHFIYQPEKFMDEAKKLLPKLTIQKASTINNYKEGDRVRYLNELWNKIKDSKTELDLKSIDDALKSYVMERLKKEIVDILEESLETLTNLNQVKSYQRYNQILNRNIVGYFSQHKPKHVKEKELYGHTANIYEQFQPTATKHFNNTVLKNIEEDLEQMVEKQISKDSKNKRLSHLIFKKKKEVTQIYKKVVNNHPEYTLLIKNFNEKMSTIISRQENRLNHLFSLFQVTVERELNIIIGKQASKLVFNEQQIKDKIKKLCLEYQYYEWEVDLVAIWERVSFRCLEKIVPEAICDKSKQMITSGTIFSGDQSTAIIAMHTSLEKKGLDFCREILYFMQEENTLIQPLSEVKEIVGRCLNQRLEEERRRWKVSWLILSFLLFLLYGEMKILLGYTWLRKSQRRMFMRTYYWGTLLWFIYCVSKQLLANRKKIQVDF